MLNHLVTVATVKMDEKTYAELNRIAGDMGASRGRPVPIEEVIRELLSKRKASEYIGSWKMSEEEERVFGQFA